MSKKALITGGAGYFGSLLLLRLLDRGYSCRILDLNNADDCPPEVEFIQGDIRDYETVLNACEGMDVVYHNVAQVPLAKNKDLFDSVNITGTDILLKAAQATGIKKVIYTSSSAVFGIPRELPVTEETIPTPGESYGRAKFEGEKLCSNYARNGLDVTIIRPRTIMGHGRLGIFQILFEWIRTGTNIPVLGDGSNIYQFVHADDLADACILASERPGSNIYNCGAENFGTMRHVLEALCIHAGTGSKVKKIPMDLGVWAMKITGALNLSPLTTYHWLMYGRSLYFDISKTRNELGWKPKFSNEQMFIASYDWYLENKNKVFSGQGLSHHRSPVKQGLLKLVQWVL